VSLREKLRGANIALAREEEEAGVIKRSIRFVVLAVPPILALAACAGATDPQADLSVGYPNAEVEPNAVAGESLQASWPGSPFPILSFEDREAIGRVSYAEAGNQGEEGIAAVIFTILNRVNSGQFGSTVQGVIDAPNQFEPASRAGGWRYLPLLDAWQSVQFETILNLILAGRLPDPTGGALFFQNAGIVAARAARGRVSPYLVDFGGTPPVAEIGDHRFYDWRAAINLTSQRYQAYDTETAYSADGIGHADGTDNVLAAELGSDATAPEAEIPVGPAWDEQQAMPTASADAMASNPLDAGGCPVGSYC
jgi:spore germination cell wall hydrolase CwlJ-like protein